MALELACFWPAAIAPESTCAQPKGLNLSPANPYAPANAAPPVISFVHDRTPVVLRPEHCDAWLDPTTTASDVAELIDAAREDLLGYPAGKKVSNVRNDGAELPERVLVPGQLDLNGTRHDTLYKSRYWPKVQ